MKNNKKIDTKLSSVLFTRPVPAIAPHTQTSPAVLPQRNLLRQLTWGLPSGQQVAKAMSVPPLKPGDQGSIMDVYLPFGSSTPLWYDILAEAKAATGRGEPRPGRGPDRHRNPHRAAARRRHQLPEQPAGLGDYLAPDAAACGAGAGRGGRDRRPGSSHGEEA